tara:strand:+ start:4389 stop:5198 length:810 start_codon:yes stop_codon:yes gene_type:complete
MWKIDWPAHNYYGKTRIDIWDKGYPLNRPSGTYARRAVKKHGRKAFDRKILKKFDTEQEALDYEVSLEPHINGYYNISPGGSGYLGGEDHLMFGKKPTKETREKMSKSQTGRKHTPESIEKMKVAQAGENNAMFGHVYTQEQRNNISVAQRHRHATQGVSQETRDKLRITSSGKNNAMYGVRGKDHPLYGKPISDEQKLALSIHNQKHTVEKIIDTVLECGTFRLAEKLLGYRHGSIWARLKKAGVEVIYDGLKTNHRSKVIDIKVPND